MNELEGLAAFVDRAQLGELIKQALEQLKIRMLDVIGVGTAPPAAPPIVAIGACMDEHGGRCVATRIGNDNTSSKAG